MPKDFDTLVAEEVAKGGPFEFEGQNCNDYLEDDQEPCSGWDGQDRRCNCGNRRVYWTLSSCQTFVYAEAD